MFNFLTPRAFRTSNADSATSSNDNTGKDNRYNDPVLGSTEAGPVDPKQLPRELTQITKNRFVSTGKPGPIISSHQPAEESSGDEDAWADGDNPENIRIALSPSPLSVPQVS